MYIPPYPRFVPLSLLHNNIYICLNSRRNIYPFSDRSTNDDDSANI